MTVVFTAARARMTLGPEVARGGEGVVWRVRERPGLVAKIYQPKPPARGAEKLEAMLARRPADPTAARLGHTSIAWPLEALFDERRDFAGFLMTGIFEGRPLVDVYNRKRRAQVLPGFDRRYLHRTAANFAAAVGALHAHGLVVGDLNESNVLVRPNALVTLIDTDSYQVPNLRGRQPYIFPCPVGKTEFTPPELQGRPFAGAVRTPEHDRFALAVLIFQLLMEGSHPFRARWLGEGEPPSTDQKISQGLFPHSRPAPDRLVPPPGLPSLDVLHPEVAALVRRCFVEGHADPTRRPLPAEWERALSAAERALVPCPNGHYYGGHLRACSWCGETPGRKKTAPKSVALESAEAPRRPVGPLPPAPRPLTPFPASSGQSNRAWRNAMTVAMVAILVLTMVTTALPVLRPPAADRPEAPTVAAAITCPPRQGGRPAGEDRAGLPRGLAVGDHVCVSPALAPVLYAAPNWRSERLDIVEPGAAVQIVGDWKRGPNETIWWEVRDPATDVSGYIWQGLLDAKAAPTATQPAIG